MTFSVSPSPKYDFTAKFACGELMSTPVELLGRGSESSIQGMVLWVARIGMAMGSWLVGATLILLFGVMLPFLR